MSTELKIISVILSIMLSVILMGVVIARSTEISNVEYYEISEEKKKWDAEPKEIGWDVYRDWLKKATADDKISRKEYFEYKDIIDDVNKRNMIYNLKK